MYKSCVVCGKLKAPLLLDSRGVCDTCIAVAKRAGIDPIDAVKAAAEAQKPPATFQEVVQEVKTQQAVVEAALPTPEEFAAEVAALRIGRHKELLVEQQALEQAEIERKEAQQKEVEVRKAAQAEKARRDLARRRLLAYTKYFEEGYEAGWLHADICRRLEQFYEAVKRGESPRMILTVPPRHGKQVADSTPVLTANRGWLTHGELVPGDEVFSPSGKPVRVLAVSEKTPSDWLVTLTNGTTVRCHEAHEWTVYDRRAHREITRETRWLASTELLNGRRCNVQLPNIAAVEYPPAPLLIHPYVLGAWLGDGSRSKACITHAVSDAAVVDAVVAAGYEATARCVHASTGVVTTYFSGDQVRSGTKNLLTGRLRLELSSLGLFGRHVAKHIPDVYQTASVEQRLELLAGLVDTDGHCDPSGRIRIVTADAPLKDGIVRLLTGLGMRPYVETRLPRVSSSGVCGRKVHWAVGFQPTLEIPCRLERKRPKRLAPQRRVGVMSVKRAPNGEVGHCIQVDSADGLYLITESLVPTHNSTLASVNFPSWVLGDDPNLEFIACSYNSSLAMDFSRKVRDRINDPKYAKLFPNTRLSDSSQSAERWNTSGKGGYVAAGVRGPITGRGAHIGVIDDPVKDREDAESEVIRQQIKNWYSSTFYTRLAPGGGVLIILTRWHDDDLAGWLIQTMVEAEKEAAESGHWPEDADKWEVVSYKAIASEDEAYRKAGEALHPARYPIKALAKIKRTLVPRDWEALYQQNPVAEEGAYFTKDMFRYYAVQPPLSSLRIYAAWDFAIGKKEANDWTVGVVVGVDKDGRIYVLHRYRGRWATNQIVEKIIECQRVWSPLLQGFEEGQIASSFEPFLIKRLNEPDLRSLGGIPYEKLKTRGRDKEARARAIQGRMQQGMVYFPEKVDWLVEFMNEFLRFPLGLHDDQVDALAWIGQMLLQLAAFTEKREKPKPGWRDRLKKRLAKQRTSVGASAMSA